MMRPRFLDRRDAGQALAASLARHRGLPDPLVLALPRGGVPVAAEIAEALGAELDVLGVRKVAHPSHPELALAAIATGGAVARNEAVIEAMGVDDAELEALAAPERRELARRERAYRGDRPPPRIAGRTVIVVDDGVATGATMFAALATLRAQAPGKLLVAVPVAAADALAALSRAADEVVCLQAPADFMAVGAWYEEFPQVSDEEVRTCLRRAAPGAPPA